ncbi:unnamed protein product [Rotaria sp. Silwood1]|nr:unnamed protein product [Rotaria sp. Silwood1]CAF1042686.1 unnamed protein product [Rotaria sp. Silwood1]CAF1338819.1 unnamed protein product [Rotaria sp. Silwood1]CAF1340753.1 unnamed protein product [Rotaria sp. Silwood1]CAF3542421.1 unnamed protein product [Rotaria sp. Silwood1]
MQRRSTLDKSSNNLFENIEQLGALDLFSCGQLSYDTILTSIQSNNTLPLPVNVMNIFVHALTISLISYYLCKSGILLEQTTKEYLMNYIYI